MSKADFLNYYVYDWCFRFCIRYPAGFLPCCSQYTSILYSISDSHQGKMDGALYGLCELFLQVASFGGDSVAHFAHLGGMLFGYFMIRYWKKKDRSNGRYIF